jgi:hypothetical protein
MAKKPRLELVGTSTPSPLAPPSTLGKAGRTLWENIQSEYVISDTGGVALLEQICSAIDGIADCDAAIARDGMMVRGKFGPREHPLLRHQLGLRAFVTRTLARLNLDVEAVKPVGRPPGSWSPPED